MQLFHNMIENWYGITTILITAHGKIQPKNHKRIINVCKESQWNWMHVNL